MVVEKNESTIDLAVAAWGSLAGPRLSIAEAEVQLPDEAGLYALHAEADAWRELGLGEPPDRRPLYVGTAASSLRDIEQHVDVVRGTLAALLRKQDRILDEAALRAWIRSAITIAVWRKPPECDLYEVEKSVLSCVVPPLNVQNNQTSRWRIAVLGAGAARP